MRQWTRPLMILSLILFASLASIRTVAANAPIKIEVSNVRDASFTVSWLTLEPEIGRVKLIGSAIYDDARGAKWSGVTHYVNVAGLRLDSTFAFDIISGGKKYDNAGAHWTVTTGTVLEPFPPDVISGLVKNADGSNAGDAIVFFNIHRQQFTDKSISARLSTLITAGDGGLFRVNLSEARLAGDPTKYFVYARGSDHLMNNSLTIQGINANGTGLLTVDIADPRLRVSTPDQAIIVNLTPDANVPSVAEQPAMPQTVSEKDSADGFAPTTWFALYALAIAGSLVTTLFAWRSMIRDIRSPDAEAKRTRRKRLGERGRDHPGRAPSHGEHISCRNV